MTLMLILDRVEEGMTAVLTDDECRVYQCPASFLAHDHKEGDAYLAKLDECGVILSLEKTYNPHRGENKSKLRLLLEKRRQKGKNK